MHSYLLPSGLVILESEDKLIFLRFSYIIPFQNVSIALVVPFFAMWSGVGCCLTVQLTQ